MTFIANGDYNFPFDFMTYFVKHFYMWSVQTGTPNPDGVIRLPGRIFNFLVFMSGGNIAVGYFYQIACLAVALVAFYFFARHFVGIKDKVVCFVGAAFFAINPIFLGNLSKVGLVLAAAMLPLCLLAIKFAFQKRQWSLLLVYVVLLNLSLLHPYTFFVNFAVSGGYAVYLLWRQRQEMKRYIPAFIGIGVLGIAMNAYLLLPIASMGTVSKDVISDNVTPIKADYTALVDVSNTGDIFTGLALAKNIFLDFEFYDKVYQNVYFIGTFLLYLLLLALYLKNERHMSVGRKRLMLISLGAFLLLIALATVHFFNIDVLIKTLISMPGGWAFRSPLKWQLYIPLALFTMLVILLAATRNKRIKIAAFFVCLVSFVAMNGYQIVDVALRQMTPRPVQYFGALTTMDLSKKNLLFINSAECQRYVIPYNSATVTELNQVFISTDVQVKRAWADSIASVNLATYDYIMTCRRDFSDLLKNTYAYDHEKTFVNGGMQLYKNKDTRPPIYATNAMYSVDDVAAIAPYYGFAKDHHENQFNFVANETRDLPITKLRDIFSQLSASEITEKRVQTTIPGGYESLAIKNDKLWQNAQPGEVTVSDNRLKGQQPIPGNSELSLDSQTSTNFTYQTPSYDYKNLIANPSLEQGLWQKEVEDCFNKDDSPDIAMKQTSQSSDGKAALQLESAKHIACTGPSAISVQPGEHYLLSFDYQSEQGTDAGYYIGFNDNESQSGDSRLTQSGKDWHRFSKEIAVPANAQQLRIKFYAYPESSGNKRTARFDNVNLVRIPPLQQQFYAVAAPKTDLAEPKNIESVRHDPTKWSIAIQGATKPFFLLTKETYHDKWQLALTGGKTLADTPHFAVNNTMNGWYIDPARLCDGAKNCTQNDDGSYDIAMTMTFVPQQWFYVGGGISIVAALIGIAWLARDVRGQKRTTQGRWR